MKNGPRRVFAACLGQGKLVEMGTGSESRMRRPR